jgi:serine/threonine-protein kinase
MLSLRREEMVRLKNFAPAVFGLCLFGLIVQRFNQAPQLTIQVPMAIALSSLGLTAAAVWWLTRNPNVYLRPALRFFAVMAVLTSFVFEMRVGVFSPMPAVVVLGISFFGRSESRVAVWSLAGLAVVGYLVLGLLVSLDLVPDIGMFSPRNLPPGMRVGMTLSIAAVYVVTLHQARMNRRSAEQMVTLARNAAVEAKRHQAQLEEANQNLERALRAAAGRSGRYTGTMAQSFRIGDLVGRGAMGEVYAATHVTTNEPAAIKLLHRTALAADPASPERFLREARITTRLHAPNIVDVYAVGEACDGAPFIAMELLVGEDLASVLRHGAPMEIADVIALVRDIASGLSVAHANGVIHRDLKPSNLFAAHGKDGTRRWKILDFGVSTLVDSNGTLTETGIVGTPNYMAPEQARGERSDHRVDLFALGAVAYRVLTGHPAFPGPGAPQILFSVVYENPIAPRAIRPALPADVEAFLAIALAKEAGDRFASAEELTAALADAAAGRLSIELRERASSILALLPWKKLPSTPPPRP